MTPQTHAVTLEHLRALNFWSRVVVATADECWPWTGGKTKQGYGTVHVSPIITGLPTNTTMMTHRVALALTVNRLPAHDMVVDHRCYTPACCNPAHLQLVSQRTNIRRSRKPVQSPVARPRKDGSILWLVRFYDYSGPERRYLSRSFEDLTAATAFAGALKAERAS